MKGRENQWVYCRQGHSPCWIPAKTCDVGSGCEFQSTHCLKEHLNFLTNRSIPNFFDTKFSATLMNQNSVINQSPLEAYVGFLCSHLKYQEFRYLVSTYLIRRRTSELAWGFRLSERQNDIIAQSRQSSYDWRNTQGRTEVRSQGAPEVGIWGRSATQTGSFLRKASVVSEN